MPSGWGSSWGQFPWGGSSKTLEATLIQKIISALKNVSGLTKFIGSGSNARIYGAFPQTIQDSAFPAITILLDFSPGRSPQNNYHDLINLQIDTWMFGIGKNADVWDDMMECHGLIMDALHRTKLWDTTLNLKFVTMSNIDEGPQLIEHGNLMRYPSRWQAYAFSV